MFTSITGVYVLFHENVVKLSSIHNLNHVRFRDSKSIYIQTVDKLCLHSLNKFKTSCKLDRTMH